MTDSPRKKSPRAPSLPLGEAIDRALQIYEKERRHAAPIDAVAQHIGYKSASNGAALAAFATLRYYGLIDRPKEGMLAITKDVETYKFAPDEKIRRDLIRKWLLTPPLFAELLDDYKDGLPSDANVKFALIQRGFNDKAADSALTVFRKSVDYANHYADRELESPDEYVIQESEPGVVGDATKIRPDATTVAAPRPQPESAIATSLTGVDRIPVRLAGGRRAWIEVPTPFYAVDKQRLKAQIDLLLVDDEEKFADS